MVSEWLVQWQKNCAEHPPSEKDQATADWLAARETEEVRRHSEFLPPNVGKRATDVIYEYLRVQPKYPPGHDRRSYKGHPLLDRDHAAWLEELKPENDRRHDAAIAAARQARDKRIARRAKLTMAALAQDLAIELPADAKAILADDDQQITLSTKRKFGPVTETIHLRKEMLRPHIDHVTTPWQLGRTRRFALPNNYVDREVRMADLGGEQYRS